MDRLKKVFDKQKELMEKYHDIEVAGGLMTTEDCPVDINTKEGQARIRDFGWRFIEELGEALDAAEKYETNPTEQNLLDLKEEYIDGLHFLTELSILVDLDSSDVIKTHPYDLDNMESLYMSSIKFGQNTQPVIVTELIKTLSMTINCLKNKAWKQKYVETDKQKFYTRLKKVWSLYFSLMDTAGLRPNDIYEMYLFKNNKNKDRQAGGY